MRASFLVFEQQGDRLDVIYLIPAENTKGLPPQTPLSRQPKPIQDALSEEDRDALNNGTLVVFPDSIMKTAKDSKESIIAELTHRLERQCLIFEASREVRGEYVGLRVELP